MRSKKRAGGNSETTQDGTTYVVPVVNNTNVRPVSRFWLWLFAILSFIVSLVAFVYTMWTTFYRRATVRPVVQPTCTMSVRRVDVMTPVDKEENEEEETNEDEEEIEEEEIEEEEIDEEEIKEEEIEEEETEEEKIEEEKIEEKEIEEEIVEDDSDLFYLGTPVPAPVLAPAPTPPPVPVRTAVWDSPATHAPTEQPLTSNVPPYLRGRAWFDSSFGAVFAPIHLEDEMEDDLYAPAGAEYSVEDVREPTIDSRMRARNLPPTDVRAIALEFPSPPTKVQQTSIARGTAKIKVGQHPTSGLLRTCLKGQK